MKPSLYLLLALPLASSLVGCHDEQESPRDTELPMSTLQEEPTLRVLDESERPEDEAPIESATLHIYGGDAPSAPHHRAVVALHQRYSSGVSNSPFCSGTLITSTVVLTAAHCLDTAKGGGNFKTMSPSSLAIYVGDGVGGDPSPSIYPVSETLIYPGYNRRSLLNDVALVRLAIAVPSGEAEPVAALPARLGLTQADSGVMLNFAGFGYDENRNFGVKLQADVALAGLGCVVAGCSSVGDPNAMFSYSQPSSGPCNGDSGGPAFIMRGGIPYVAGMTSFGDSNCTLYGVSSRADTFESFINLFTGEAPTCVADNICDPLCESDPDCAVTGGESAMGGEPAPGGDPVMGGEPTAGGESAQGGEPTAPSCGDGICDDGESCDGRRGTTACASDCDSKLNGQPSRRYCYVGASCEGRGCP